LVHDVFPECDVTGVMKGLLAYFRSTRIMYKNLSSEYKKIDKKKSLSYDRKQLPIKIFINAFFGSLSAPLVFNWGDINQGERIKVFVNKDIIFPSNPYTNNTNIFR
jgi:DNA polymerase elongation subunit (family B)